MTQPRPSRSSSWATGAVYLIALVGLGFVLGGTVATRLFPSGGMGWDQIANALGGVLVGVIVSAVVGAITVVRLSPRARLLLAGAAVAAVVACFAYASLTPPPGRPQSVPAAPTAPPG